MYPLRVLASVIWILWCSLLGLILAPFRWKDISYSHDIGRWYAFGVLPLLKVKIKIEGEENLTAHQPCIYVANHQSALDVPVFSKIYPKKTVAIGKKELIWIPLFGILFAACGNLLIHRKNPKKARRGIGQVTDTILEKGASVFIFPEGTRNRKMEGLLPFKKGAFHMACDANVPIVPIVVSSYRSLFDPQDKKWKGGWVQIRVLSPVFPPQEKNLPVMKEQCIRELCDLTYQKMNQALHGRVESSS